jgi:hypothetical protein
LPSYQTAKQISENALRVIGAFPIAQSQADAGELRVALTWLEMVLNSMSGIRPLAGFWTVIEIPLEAGIGDYDLNDYCDDAHVQEVFSISRVDGTGDPVPLDMMYENDEVLENLTQTGTTQRVIITRGVEPVLKAYPTPTQTEEDAGVVLRVRLQGFHPAIDPTGVAGSNINLRPSWYLMLIKRLAYEIGSGPVRRLAEGELRRLDDDAGKLQDGLLARDGMNNAKSPPITDPVEFG